LGRKAAPVLAHRTGLIASRVVLWEYKSCLKNLC
jgi:hypothetical protein